MEAATILLVDDDQELGDSIAQYLQVQGFDVHTAYDGPSALSIASRLHPQLVVLDMLLPRLDGIEVCRALQHEADILVLMLTARSDEIDRLAGLSAGADDYLTKPFSLRELLARINALLRRNRMLLRQPVLRSALMFGALQIDPERREVSYADSPIQLTPREFDLLYALACSPGRVFTREELLEIVWGPDFVGIDRVVDVHIGTLRRKIDDVAAVFAFVQTVRGVGYKFVSGVR